MPVARLSTRAVPGNRLHTMVVYLAPSGDPALRYLAIASLDLPRVERLITGALGSAAK